MWSGVISIFNADSYKFQRTHTLQEKVRRMTYLSPCAPPVIYCVCKNNPQGFVHVHGGMSKVNVECGVQSMEHKEKSEIFIVMVWIGVKGVETGIQYLCR